MHKRVFFFLFVLIINSGVLKADTDPRLVIHLLDYIATDYSRAVAKGKVINEFEYAEMQDFAEQVNNLLGSVNADTTKLLAISAELGYLIDGMVEPDAIAAKSNELKNALIIETNISLAPNKWPKLENGKELYKANCLSCHGANGAGNGPAAAGLDPEPTDFTNVTGMSDKSPLQAYHTIRFGVEGTSMTAFNTLSDDEVWDLAFYINTLRFNKNASAEPKKELDLVEVATNSDNQLKAQNATLGENDIHYWRFYQPKKSKNNSLLYAREMLVKAEKLAIDGKAEEAVKASLNAYLEGIEPIELSLNATDPKLVQEIELEFGALRKLYKTNKLEEIKAKTALLLALIAKAEKTLEDKESSWWLTFSLAASVILREGLEAFLIIVIILSVLRTAGAKSGVKYVHGGWILAVVLGIVGWFSTEQLMKMSGMQRELLEGLVALIAVAILFYIGFWMHGKSEAQKWNEYIKNKIQKMLNKQSMLGLGALSFLVVFREAFESVLFLSAISLEDGDHYKGAIGLGVLVAFAIVGILAVLMMKFSKKLPIAQLFKFSSIIIAILSVVLVGKGIHAIQEAGYIGITAFPINIRISLLGVFPTLQSIMAQFFMICLTLIVWKIQNRTKPQIAKA